MRMREARKRFGGGYPSGQEQARFEDELRDGNVRER
jgi:hypothetical protein